MVSGSMLDIRQGQVEQIYFKKGAKWKKIIFSLFSRFLKQFGSMSML
jgi:hypothetical protein